MALLQHYFSETATVLPADFQYGNPFIRHVIPAAHANDALMHAVLSMSGAQLTYRLGDALPIKLATYQHYSRTLLEIRKHLAAIERKDEVVTPELCLALIFLCNYEILARSSSATFRLHLRALRHCINSLSKDNANSLRRSQNDDVQVFLRADYNYILFCNVITPSAVDQHLGLDWYSVHSENDSEDTNMESIFAGSHDLFALIPRAASLYHARLDEEAAGLVEPSTELQTKHNELLSCIESWEMDNGRMMTPAATVAEKDNNGCYGQNRTLFKEKRATAAECIRDCLRIYTLLSLAGSSAGPQFAQDELLATHVSSVYWMLASLQGSSCMAHMIWAIVIVGSCVVDKAQQALLANGLTQSTYRMPHLENIRLVLELLWEDEDPRAFGPYGLLLIERKHGLKLSVL